MTKEITTAENKAIIDTLRAKVRDLRTRVQQLEMENTRLKKVPKVTGTAKAHTAKPGKPSTRKPSFAKQRANDEFEPAIKTKKAPTEKVKRFNKHTAEDNLAVPTEKKPQAKFSKTSPTQKTKVAGARKVSNTKNNFAKTGKPTAKPTKKR